MQVPSPPPPRQRRPARPDGGPGATRALTLGTALAAAAAVALLTTGCAGPATAADAPAALAEPAGTDATAASAAPGPAEPDPVVAETFPVGALAAARSAPAADPQALLLARARPSPGAAAGGGGSFGARDDVVAFASDVAQRRGLDTVWVLEQVAQARSLPSVQRLVMPPPAGTAKDWAAYRDRFVEPKRIAAGVAFWDAHAAALARAEARWGVPAAIVVGVVGVETFYGRITGNYRIVDALATLAFDFPSGRSDRSGFFRAELEEFLVWAAREGADPQRTRGSYAGAIGLPQFMPGSINRFAVDFDGDGHVDLAGSAADAIGSVAHYLAMHGWQAGMAPTYTVAPPVDTAARARLLAPDIVPSFTPDEFAAAGAELDAAGRRHGGKLALVELQNGAAAPSHVAGTQNFYAITRYNQSSYYAMAVIALGDAVAAERRRRASAGRAPG